MPQCTGLKWINFLITWRLRLRRRQLHKAKDGSGSGTLGHRKIVSTRRKQRDHGLTDVTDSRSARKIEETAACWRWASSSWFFVVLPTAVRRACQYHSVDIYRIDERHNTDQRQIGGRCHKLRNAIGLFWCVTPRNAKDSAELRLSQRCQSRHVYFEEINVR